MVVSVIYWNLCITLVVLHSTLTRILPFHSQEVASLCMYHVFDTDMALELSMADE